MIHPVEWLRVAGPVVMAITIVAGFILIASDKRGRAVSISTRIASNAFVSYLAGLLLTVGGAVFFSFMAFWLIPYYSIHPVAYGILVIAFIAQLGLAWIPDSRSNRRRHIIHFACGGTLGLCMTVLLIIFSFSFATLPPASGWIVVGNAVIAVTIISLYFVVPSTRRHFLVYESGFISLFALTCIVLAIAA